ncbi:MAG TPA: hypothetical protein VHN99_08225, partial [Deinococcales bacterium]|nr:hypothetical protein [Deinococcales bacterium]
PAVTMPRAAVPAAAVPVATATAQDRRGTPLWWLLPLVALLALGAWWLFGRGSGAAVQVTSPQDGASIPAQAFAVSGTGASGDTIKIMDGGQQVGSGTVGSNGTWSVQVPAPTPGEHTFEVQGNNSKVSLKTTVTAAAVGTEGFSIGEPAANAEIPAGAFTMKGTGTPGTVIDVLEDGTSLGKATVGADGAWTFNVPPPAAGAHTYSLKGPDGKELGTLAATVAAPTGTAADCTSDFSVSLKDGQTITQPFRFGGAGKGKGYTVVVKRAGRTVGTKVIPLDNSCGWSYTSKPGPGQITYEVSETGGTAGPISTINLTVK